MISKSELAQHILDYARVFGRATDCFVCPITLRKCSESELIKGHILNRQLTTASRRTVIQYKGVDEFYGTRVEAAFVKHLNRIRESSADMLTASNNIIVHFHDGSTARGFVPTGVRGKAAQGHLPVVDVIDGESLIPIHVDVPLDDPRLERPIRGTASVVIWPAYDVATLIKCSLLATFEMIGYKAICNPWGDTVRRSVAMFYKDRAKRQDVWRYFHDFRNSIKLCGKGQKPSDLKANYQPFEFDTLDTRMVLLHFAGPRYEKFFAATDIFQINGATITVTLPQSATGTDEAFVWRWYKSLMDDEFSVDQRVHRAKFAGDKWLCEATPMNANYVRPEQVFTLEL